MSAPAALAILAPGYGGTSQQPILQALGSALGGRGIGAQPITFSTRGRRPSPDYQVELDDLRQARDRACRDGARQVALVGRSFGGRMCALLAASDPPAGLVVLGHPIAPPGRPRPADAAALASVTCPTLIVQGERDELGPLAVLERLAAQNPRIELVVLPGVGHAFGRAEPVAVARAADWLAARLVSR